MYSLSPIRRVRNIVVNVVVGIALLHFIDMGLNQGLPKFHTAVGAVKAQIVEVRGY